MTLKDHLRSLTDKKPPSNPEPSPEPTSDRPVALGQVKESLVTIAADEKTGKGFIVDGEGKVVTNFQLVNSAARIKVTTLSGDVFLGKITRLDKGRDLALIQIPVKTPRYLTLGDVSTVDVGEDVFILGSSSGAGGLIKAVISALRVIEGTALIQVDRPIDPDNSGSPFVTEQGTVVGIASYRMGQQDDNVGFAVSVKELKAFISGQ
ncbi:serine protease [Acidobacteria bacterium AH-259-G07]|nr:serine protease [Acidobacteria bacterium AH-259-G07]